MRNLHLLTHVLRIPLHFHKMQCYLLFVALSAFISLVGGVSKADPVRLICDPDYSPFMISTGTAAGMVRYTSTKGLCAIASLGGHPRANGGFYCLGPSSSPKLAQDVYQMMQPQGILIGRHIWDYCRYKCRCEAPAHPRPRKPKITGDGAPTSSQGVASGSRQNIPTLPDGWKPPARRTRDSWGRPIGQNALDLSNSIRTQSGVAGLCTRQRSSGSYCGCLLGLGLGRASGC